MPVQDVMDELSDRENLKDGLSVFGGYFVSGQVTSRIVELANDYVGVEVPPEADGLVTAAAMYGYGDEVVADRTANMMAIGGMVHAYDSFTDRESVKSAIPEFDNLTGGGN